MTNDSIIGTINWKRSLLTLSISIFLQCIFTFGFYTNFQKFKAVSIPLLLFNLFFFLVFLYALLQFLDRKPLIIISQEGIAMRKLNIPFVKLKHFAWPEISYYRTTLSVVKGMATFCLFIGGNNLKKEYYTELSSLNIDESEVLKLMSYYSSKYNIQDFGRSKP